MTDTRFRQLRLRVPNRHRRQIRTQFGALCWRRKKEKVQVLLVTSRGSGRWIIPKGWPVGGETPSRAAATEAFEEAGAAGHVGLDCLGIYSYLKLGDKGPRKLPCIVAVFPLQVRHLYKDYPERHQRRRRWVSLKKAARMVNEPELAAMIRNFTPA